MVNRHLPPLTQTRVLSLAKIRRERTLPVNGEVLVTMGSRVGALDVVARAASVGFLRPVPLARYMHTTESALPKIMKKQVGDDIIARDEIASKPELFGAARRVYRAPGNGRIMALQGSWLTMDLMDAPFDLRGYYRGAIVNIVPRRGVIIEASGALVEGTWALGGEAYGILKKMVDVPGAILTEDMMDVSARGAILIGGAGITQGAIERAVQEQAAGLIVGSISAKIKMQLDKLKLPVMVTEGFGEIPMALPIFELLARHAGEEAFLNAKMPKPEVFVPALVSSVSGETATLPPTLTCEIGATVRITSGPLIGQVGKIVDAPALPQVLESGISVWGADIELMTGNRVFVPWENLELIG